MGIPFTHVKFYWTVFAKTHHAAPPQDLNASPAKWLFAALEARPVFRITGATCVKGIPIFTGYEKTKVLYREIFPCNLNSPCARPLSPFGGD